MKRVTYISCAVLFVVLAGFVLLDMSPSQPPTADARPGADRSQERDPPAAAMTGVTSAAAPDAPASSMSREDLLAELYASSDVDDSLLGARLAFGRQAAPFDTVTFLQQAFGLAGEDSVALAQVARFCFSPAVRYASDATFALQATCRDLDVVAPLLALERGNAWVHLVEALALGQRSGDPLPALGRALEAVYFDDFDGRARLRLLEAVTRAAPRALTESITREALATHEALEVLAPLGRLCFTAPSLEASCLALADYFERAQRPGARSVYLHLAGIADPAEMGLPLTLVEYEHVMREAMSGESLGIYLIDLERYEAASALRRAAERHGVIEPSTWEPEPLGVIVFDAETR